MDFRKEFPNIKSSFHRVLTGLAGEFSHRLDDSNPHRFPSIKKFQVDLTMEETYELV
jgi:hypothetical protein